MWFTSVTLKDACFHIPVALHHLLEHGTALRLKANMQEAGYIGSHREVPGLTEAASSQLPTTSGSSHGSLISHSNRSFALSPISALANM